MGFEDDAAKAAEDMRQERERLSQSATKTDINTHPLPSIVYPGSQIEIKFEDEVKALKEEAKSIFAPDPTTVSIDYDSAFIFHLIQTIETKEREMKSLETLDAEAIKKIAKDYIQSDIDSIQIQIAKEHFRLTTLEQKSIGYLSKISAAVKNFLIALASIKV